uniref:FF domain-containing protein n=1 Tax=Ciona savignyi TaxID=51511 RepID=H2Z8C3_CIOSA
MKQLRHILLTLKKLTCRTTWSECQQMLMDNHLFAEDEDLQNMDKEDALICFEDVIKEFDKEDKEKQDRKKTLEKRVFRKHRQRFVEMLDKLHEDGKLHFHVHVDGVVPHNKQQPHIHPHAGTTWLHPPRSLQVLCDQLESEVPRRKEDNQGYF